MSHFNNFQYLYPLLVEYKGILDSSESMSRQKDPKFLIRITSRVDLAMSVCPSVRINAEISETIRARLLRFGMQIPKLLTQRKFVSAA